MDQELKDSLDALVKEHPVVIFMKGTRLFPQCGFSATVVEVFKRLQVPFHGINVLENPAIRQGIKEYSNWPTIPQVYIGGEFIGGSDIMIELYQNGKLQEMVEVALAS